jgi:hypothetical protein
MVRMSCKYVVRLIRVRGTQSGVRFDRGGQFGGVISILKVLDWGLYIDPDQQGDRRGVRYDSLRLLLTKGAPIGKVGKFPVI